ncbi:hypothetical protein CVN56_29985 [Rhodococcus sp. AQ5-07]|nr:hypothetical protein CVN56_29985 [Rhodococcus sp. AQ5-07]
MVNLPAVQITRAAVPDVGTFYGDANYNLRTNVLAETGQPLSGFEHSKITAKTYGPVNNFASFTADKGAGTDSFTYVVDRVSGEVKATVDTAAISAVGGELQKLFDGIVYVKNGDEVFTLDALTGKERGQVKTIPLREINGWILHAEGTLIKSE